MNEVLKRLSLLAGGSHYPTINPDMQAKFAELIVRECVLISRTSTDGFSAGRRMEEHFGLREHSEIK